MKRAILVTVCVFWLSTLVTAVFRASVETDSSMDGRHKYTDTAPSITWAPDNHITIQETISVTASGASALQASSARDYNVYSLPPSTIWNKTYGATGDDKAHCVVQTGDGGYALAGTYDYWEIFGFWVVKTDSAGGMEWNRTYGVGVANSLIQTSDGGYAIAGYKLSLEHSINRDAWLVKTNSDGNVEWNRTYGGGTFDDYAYSLVQTKDGGYAIAGFTLSFGAGFFDAWLVKTDSAGGMEWNKTYGGADDDRAYSVVQTSDGGYAIAGHKERYPGGYDFWLVKTDSAGDMKWNKTYGGALFDCAISVVQTSDGGYAIAGEGFANLVKTDADGNLQWKKSYGGTALSVIQTTEGGYALAGIISGAGSWDLLLVKTNSSGSVEWSETCGGTDYESGNSVLQTSQGDYIVAGVTGSSGAGGLDAWLIKVGLRHDVALIGMKARPSPVLKGEPVNINVTIENHGDFAEIFEVALYADSITSDVHIHIETRNVSLDVGESTLLEFVWNITEVPNGGYLVTAEALLPTDAKPRDNMATVYIGKKTSTTGQGRGGSDKSNLVLD